MFGIQLRPCVSDCGSLSLRCLCDRDFEATVTPASLLIVLHKYTGEKWFGLKRMRVKRSKLELYIEILNIINQRRMQKLTSILDEINTSGNFPKGTHALPHKARSSRTEKHWKTSRLQQHPKRHNRVEILQ